jgi:hypothetical protein
MKIAIDVNGITLLKIINSIKDDNILIGIYDDKSPILIDSATFANQKTILLPIRRH